jgi:hypothetical protein
MVNDARCENPGYGSEAIRGWSWRDGRERSLGRIGGQNRQTLFMSRGRGMPRVYGW